MSSESSILSPEQWQTLIDEQVDSGQSVAEFCRQQGMAVHRFRYWKRKNLEQAQGRGFRELPLCGASGVRMVFEGARWQVEVDRGFDEQCLRQVLGVLG